MGQALPTTIHFHDGTLRRQRQAETPGAGDGKRFDATDRVDRAVTLANTWVQPDIWVSGRFVFEVPASALAGAHVVFSLPSPTGVLLESYAPEAEIDLGLDEETARKLAASPQDVYSVVEK
ncbi:MAG TPA: hypothetical protein VFV66_15230 [Nonomuraea sp.]|nr:hypothetical protein [Nonomuraea sp.]